MFRCQGFFLFLSASPRLREKKNILSRRRRGAETRAQSFLIFRLPESFVRDCLRQAQAARNTG
ncbi:MAG: hypothetical protein B6245_14160 [Desulfobacteraceae bacterium 4572_88]|nr:MAG: hypothetical protein B6245_14160 [Desulfobacteraceae bacterium 4572_88]